MSMKKKYLCFLGLLVLSLLIRLALLDYCYVKVIEADGVSYVNSAKGFLDGFSLSKISIIDQPLFPILIAFLSWFAPDWETAGRMVSIISGSLIGPLIFLISEAKNNPLRISIFAGLIASILPVYVISSFQVFSDTLNCFFLLVGVWQLFVALKDTKSISFLLSGAGFALAYLTRHDSIVPSFFGFAIVGFYLFVPGLKRKKWFDLFLFITGFAVLSIPYIIFLYAQTGTLAISGRQIMIQKNFSSVKAVTEGGNYEEIQYGLADDLTIRSDVSSLIRSKPKTESDKSGMVDSWMSDPNKMIGVLGKNLGIEWRVFIEEIALILIVLAAVVIIAQRSNFFYNNLPFFAYSSPLLFLYPVFWVDARHLYHFYLPVMLWAAEGIELLPSIVMPKSPIWQRVIKKYNYTEIFKYLLFIVIFIIIVSSFKSKEIGPIHLSYLRQKEMGVWINRNVPKDSVIMTRWGRIGFYTDRKTVIFPYAEWEDIKRYMEKNGVTHLVVDESFLEMRPQLRHLLSPIFSGSSVSPDNSLSIVRLKRDRFGGMIVYDVKNN